MRRLHPTWNVGELYGVLCLEFSKDKINEMSEAARSNYTAASWRVSCVVISAVGVALCIAFGSRLICRAILRPLRVCMDAVKGLTGEDFSDVAKTAGNDEVAQMTRVINATVESMQTRVNRMLEVLGRVAKGDYCEQLQVVGKDALAHLGEGMKTFFHEKQRRSSARPTSPKTTESKPRTAPQGRWTSLTSWRLPPKATSPRKSRSRGTNPSTSWPPASARCSTDLSHLIGQVTESTAQFKEGSRVIAEAPVAGERRAEPERVGRADDRLHRIACALLRRGHETSARRQSPRPGNQQARRARRHRGAKIDPGHDADPRQLASRSARSSA